jgi:hypothetical protein
MAEVPSEATKDIPGRAIPAAAAARVLLPALLAALLLGGCASGYRYRYEPLPAVVQINTSAAQTLDMLLISVLGAKDGENGALDEVHVRFRIDNGTSQPARLLVDKLQLLSGDLLEFTAPRLIGGTAEAAPGQAVLADVAFLYPDNVAPDLRGLTLTWALLVEATELSGTLTFRRVQSARPPDSYGGYGPFHDPFCDPFWPHTHVGIGFSHVH